MINLLPTQVKKDIGFGRRNTKLLSWATFLLLGIVGIVLILGSGLLYMNSSISSYNKQISQTKQELENQKLEETSKRVEEISNSVQLVTKVLSREVLFSKLFKQIGSVIPPNAVLTGIQLGKLEGAIDLSAAATDYKTATQVQVNLADPVNKIFDGADIINITCSGSQSTDPRYPCVVTIRAQFSKNNPFLFINPTGSKN